LAAESTLVLPSSAELESLALVLEGRIAYGEGESAKAPSAPVLSAWSALRAPSAGYSLRARDEKASVLVVVLSRSGTLAQAIARGRQKNASKSEKARLEVADLAASPTLRWGNGTNVARIAFGAKAGAERGASLSLLQVSGRGQLPETVHPAEWEHIAIVRGSGDLVLGNARYPVNPGAVFHVPRGTIHGFQGSGEDLAAITVFSPAGPEQRYVEAAAKERPQP
jgi:mannose-6-phosphate isomerase-like protein (cupin superfamily)